MDLSEILSKDKKADQKISLLKKKSVSVPEWEKLRRSYEPGRHKIVRDYRGRPNQTFADGTIQKATRYRLGMEKLLVSRMTGFMFAIPVKRLYQEPEDLSEEQKKTYKQIIKAIEKVYKVAHIDSINRVRARQYFASCEIFTLWYTTNSPHNQYGFPSKHKFKCKTYSPMDGNTKLYPIFEGDDLVAMSIGYSRTVDNKTVNYFETYTKDKHYKWHTEAKGWVEDEPEDISSYGKIPGVYMYREEPIFGEDLDYIRENIEYKLSENSDTISDNASPLLASSGEIKGMEKRSDSKRSVKLENGGDLKYVTWDQGIDAMKFHIDLMMDIYFMLAQLPNISSSKMMNLSNVSYESRQMLFADAHMKVGDESGNWTEFLEREFNLIKRFVGQANEKWQELLEMIECDHVITPFIQKDMKSIVSMLMDANGGKPVMSQKTAIQHLDIVDDADAELAQIQAEEEASASTQQSQFPMFTAN